MRTITIRSRTAAVVAVAALTLVGGTLAYGAAANPPDVVCTSSPCTVTVTLPTPTVTETVTGPTTTVTETVTAPPVSTTATSTAPATTTAATTTTPPPSTTTAPAAGCPVAGANKPGAADGKGGCFPGPGNSGIPAGTTLTAYTGPLTITTAGTTIDAKTIPSRLYVNAANVTITRSSLANGIENQGANPFTITDSLVKGANLDAKAIDTDRFTALRNEIKGGNSGGWCSDCTLTDNWIHNDVVLPAGDSHHLSAYRMDQRGTFTHNTLACEAAPNSAGGGCSANLTGYGDFANVTNNTVQGNLFVASTNVSFCGYGGSSLGKPFSSGAHDIVFKGNVFQRGTNAKCGAYRAIGDYDPTEPGNYPKVAADYAASDNRWDDGSLLTVADFDG